MMRPGLENNLTDSSKNLTYLSYTLERAAVQSAAAGGDGRYVVIIDYASGEFSLRRAPSLSTSKATLSIIQDHYPERLAAAFMCDSPSYFYPAFRLIKPFIDPVTFKRSKRLRPCVVSERRRHLPLILLHCSLLYHVHFHSSLRAIVHWIKSRSAREDKACAQHLSRASTPIEYGGDVHYDFSPQSYFEVM